MRSSDKQTINQAGSGQVFGVDFHHFLAKESAATSVELASEFGLSLREVRALKKKLERG
ncbi:RNA polymerase subunit sigma-70 [Bacillus sp. 2205SS5-2]|uniref:RNA polymerase subunit sigma-70 n=1 Tax=Bacillus sp. 2205SS5-2 TaxID=3109031 RepID=UPI0030065462